VGGFYNLPGLKPGKPPAAPTTPASGTDAAGNPLTIEIYNDTTFGYLRVTATATSLTVQFVTVDPATGKTGTGDTFTVNLAAGTVSNSAAAKKPKPGKKPAKSSAPSKTAAKKAAKSPTKKANSKPKPAHRKK
jgi:outer membrane protein assembly factor BamE (lipoprotein component of BamABCDE complex)